jgi:N-methylhydantoinase A
LSSISNKQIKYLGIDAGGTFTDFVLLDGLNSRTHKVLSTPDNPADAIMQGIKELALMACLKDGSLGIVHGSTVATNAALEGKGAKTLYLGNKGFKDLLTIGRQARQELYNLSPSNVPPPVPEELCAEVDCRLNYKGESLVPLTQDEIKRIKAKIATLKPEAIAINLLFSFISDADEKALEAELSKDYFVSRSSFVLPVYKEYERGIATWLNASLGPRVQSYMSSLQKQLGKCEVSVMQSSGGVIGINEASKRAVNLLLSGPAGGLSAVRLIGKVTNNSQILSFDMGGTSTDVALMDKDFHLTNEGRIKHWPVAVPMLEMDTIGAGGGSIAWVDEAGMLHVGPESAGSSPGPACYGRGGQVATVTDANLVLGRLGESPALAGHMQLDQSAAQQAIDNLGQTLGLNRQETALGIIRIAEEQMVEALHNISVKQGYSPNKFTLCCFGGAGGMHVCALAERLKMTQAIVPQNAGVLSAFGMLSAPELRFITHSFVHEYNDIAYGLIEQKFAELESELLASLSPSKRRSIRFEQSIELRYSGQSYTINVDFGLSSKNRFEAEHERRYGHRLNKPVEAVNLNLAARGPEVISDLPKKQDLNSSQRIHLKTGTDFIEGNVAHYERETLAVNQKIFGPAIISENASTTWLAVGWQSVTDTYGNLLLNKV